MGRYSEKNWNNQNSAAEDAIGGMFTAGLLNLVPNLDLAYKCEITDSQTGLVGVTEEWQSSREIAHDVAWNDLQEKIFVSHENRKNQLQRELRESNQKSNTEEETDSSGWLIKWAFYIALFIAAVWLAFAVALPLILINSAAVSCVAGLIYKDYRKYLYSLSLIGTVFILVDYNKGWLTKTLVNNIAFFSGAIPFFLYLNIACGLIAAYFLIRDIIDEKNPPLVDEGEFSKRNLIIMGSLLAIGGTTVLLQRHFDAQRNTRVIGFTNNANNQSYSAVKWDSTKMDSTKMDSAKMTDTTSINKSNGAVKSDSSKIDNSTMSSISVDNNAASDFPGSYPQASARLLVSDDVVSLNKQDLRIMRNEIFARHGYIFKTTEMKGYFERLSWYKPIYDDVTNQLTSVEKSNVEFIKGYEK